MTARLVNDFLYVTPYDISKNDTEIKIDASEISKLPILKDGDWFPMNFRDIYNNQEIVHAISIGQNSITVLRAQENTTAKDFIKGSEIDIRLTVEAIDSFLGLYYGARLSPPQNVRVGAFYLDTSITPNKAKILTNSGWIEIYPDMSKYYLKTDVDSLLNKQLNINQIPVGQLIFSVNGLVPDGTLKANGFWYNKADYPQLNSFLNGKFGSSSTQFALPDYRGYFIRGLDDGRGIDANRTDHSIQQDAIRNITGRLNAAGAISWQAGEGAMYLGGLSATLPSSSPQAAGGGSLYFDASRQVPTAAEVRPKNIAMLFCIKY